MDSIDFQSLSSSASLFCVLAPVLVFQFPALISLVSAILTFIVWRQYAIQHGQLDWATFLVELNNDITSLEPPHWYYLKICASIIGVWSGLSYWFFIREPDMKEVTLLADIDCGDQKAALVIYEAFRHAYIKFEQMEEEKRKIELKKKRLVNNCVLGVAVGVLIAVLFIFMVVPNHHPSPTRCCTSPRPSFCDNAELRSVQYDRNPPSLEDIQANLIGVFKDVVAQTPQVAVLNRRIENYIEDQKDPMQLSQYPLCLLLTGTNGVGKNLYIKSASNAVNDLQQCSTRDDCSSADVSDCLRARGYLPLSIPTTRSCDEIIAELGDWLPSVRRRGFHPIVVFDEIHLLNIKENSKADRSWGYCLLDIINSQSLIHPVTKKRFSMSNVIVFATINHFSIDTYASPKVSSGVEKHRMLRQDPLYKRLEELRWKNPSDKNFFQQADTLLYTLAKSAEIGDLIAWQLLGTAETTLYPLITSKCHTIPFFDFDWKGARELFKKTANKEIPDDIEALDATCNEPSVGDRTTGKVVDFRERVIDTLANVFAGMMNYSIKAQDASFETQWDGRAIDRFSKEHIRLNFGGCIQTDHKRFVVIVESEKGTTIRSACLLKTLSERELKSKICETPKISTEVETFWREIYEERITSQEKPAGQGV